MTGRTIADRYELETKLGSGGMGTVWRAKDRVLERTVAVKLLHEGLAEDAAFAERFRREARAAASLGHPNVATVYDTGRDDGLSFIVMEYVDGESLHKVIQREGPLPVEDTARIGRSILGALGQAHARDLVHRDMKPANVLLDARSGEAKVVDFGIAKGLDETGGLTKTSGLIGTAAYLSPEQVNGQDARPPSDLYAVGCLLYACLAGEPPFSGSTPVAIAMRHLNDPVPSLRQRRPDVPPDFEAVIMRALEKDPANRFATAADMDAAIAATGLDRRESSDPIVAAAATVPATAALREHPVGRTVASGTEVVSRPPSTGTSLWLPAVTAFLLVAAIAAVAVLYLQSRDGQGAVDVPLPLESTAPAATPAPSTAPPETPTPTPAPTPAQPATPRNPLGNLPGFGGGGGGDEPQPTPTPAVQTLEP